MSKTEPIPFNCTGCSAKYEVVTIESPLDVLDHERRCRNCSTPFPAVEGSVFFKYVHVKQRKRKSQ
jgi:hypothetical protein